MRSFYYDNPSEHVHAIEICRPHQTRNDLKEYLTFILDSKVSNNILNHIILGETAYAEGDLIIVNRQNEIVNIKVGCHNLFIKKRVMAKNDYLEYFFKYNFKNDKYEYQVIKNENGSICNVTEQFNEGEVISELIGENKALRFYPNINIINDKMCIISGRNGIQEISDEEISLYSPQAIDEDPNTQVFQRYRIVKNATKEEIGYITFDFRYTNIAYAIKEEHRGHHYARKALKLMLELIKNNVNFEKDNLYVRIDKDNLASIKTAEACDLEIVNDFRYTQEYIVNPQKILTVR